MYGHYITYMYYGETFSFFFTVMPKIQHAMVDDIRQEVT